VHCLIAYGVQLTSLRVAVRSLAGCFYYGGFRVAPDAEAEIKVPVRRVGRR